MRGLCIARKDSMKISTYFKFVPEEVEQRGIEKVRKKNSKIGGKNKNQGDEGESETYTAESERVEPKSIHLEE
jgi:hypothetical protein